MPIDRYYVTMPLYHAAVAPEIGLLYRAIFCDAVARHWRSCGYQVAQFSGVEMQDGSPEPTGPQAGDADSAAQNYRTFAELAERAGVRCTHPYLIPSESHAHAVQTLLRRTMRRSHFAIYKSRYEGRFCLHDKVDVSDSAAPANCPRCGRAAELISEERYFFRLTAFRDRLLTLYKYRPDLVLPRSKCREIANFVLTELKDIPISRKAAERGVAWPTDSEHVVAGCYADPASYLSAIGFAGDEHAMEEFDNYWPASLQLAGHDALRLHAAHWPAFLMAADLPVPAHVFAHGELKFAPQAEGDPGLPKQLLERLGGDVLRYCLLREVAYDEDSQLSFEALVRRFQADLAGKLESLVRQLHTLVARHCDGKIPYRSILTGVDWSIEIATKDLLAEARFLFDHNNFSEGLSKICSLIETISRGDLEKSPRAIDPARKLELTNWLHDACEGLGLITLHLHAILPRATGVIWKSLGQTRRLEDQLIDRTPWGFLRPGTPFTEPEELFPATDSAHRLPPVSRAS